MEREEILLTKLLKQMDQIQITNDTSTVAILKMRANANADSNPQISPKYPFRLIIYNY